MVLDIKYSFTNNHLFNQTRILFESLDQTTVQSLDSNPAGIRIHNRLVGFLCKFFGKAILIQMKDGKAIYLNKNSLDKWLKQHGGKNHQLTYEANIQKIYSHFVYNSKNKAASIIQRAVKSHQAREELKTLKAASVIQRAVKSHQAREELKTLKAASIIQRAVKSHQAREELKTLKAASIIQRAVKSHQAREELKTLKAKAKELVRNENIYKIFNIAKSHLLSLEKFCYLSDGQINNESEKRWTLLYGYSCTTEPNKLRKKANLLRSQGDEAKAKKLELTANKVEGQMQKHVDSMPKTLFPIKIEKQSLHVNDIIENLNLDQIQQTTFFHGTTIQAANSIKKDGFKDSVPSNRVLDSGSGFYCTPDKQKAIGYAENNTAGVIALQVKVNKVANIKNYSGLFSLTVTYFKRIVEHYSQQNEQQIINEFESQGIKKENNNIYDQRLNDFKRHLINEFTKLFFIKLGYEAIYTPFSSRAGCGYINIFEPSKQNVILMN